MVHEGSRVRNVARHTGEQTIFEPMKGSIRVLEREARGVEVQKVRPGRKSVKGVPRQDTLVRQAHDRRGLVISRRKGQEVPRRKLLGKEACHQRIPQAEATRVMVDKEEAQVEQVEVVRKGKVIGKQVP